MALHRLKTWPHEFQAILDRRKTYEIRVNDREFQVGDTLGLEEYDPETETFSGRTQLVRITYMTPGGEWGLPPELCVMAIRVGE